MTELAERYSWYGRRANIVILDTLYTEMHL